MDIEPTSLEDQVALLRVEAARKRCTIMVHRPQRTAAYLTLRDQQNGALIGRYDTAIELEDSLINWVDDPALPAIDERDGAR